MVPPCAVLLCHLNCLFSFLVRCLGQVVEFDYIVHDHCLFSLLYKSYKRDS